MYHAWKNKTMHSLGINAETLLFTWIFHARKMHFSLRSALEPPEDTFADKINTKPTAYRFRSA